ncbi:uncharacterized protein LOC132300523 isoform X2 [Cornus florida]|uniref:uncharacterized protein LOC132300523 isoform X2 n=1 Tax=Cornus florida TaxID=4283 RepID=UPI0028A25130|nr:uncharacterized protein LOC132300523 isoform X2 [Cornus florida]
MRIREEERKKRPNGEEPTRTEMYILTHTQKNGQPMDEASAKIIIKQLKEYATQQPETSQRGAARDGIFSQVVGEDRHGLVRTYGLGPSPSDIWGTTPSCVKSMKMASEGRKACEEEVHDLKEVQKLKQLIIGLQGRMDASDNQNQLATHTEQYTTQTAPTNTHQGFLFCAFDVPGIGCFGFSLVMAWDNLLLLLSSGEKLYKDDT